MIALVASAWAASAAGFTTPGAEPTHAVALQVAGLFDADRAYGQARLLGQVHLGRLGFDAELTGLAGTGTTHWSDAGLGALAVGVRGFFGGPKVQHALGVAMRSSFADTGVSFWVLQGAHAQQSPSVSLTWDVTAGPERAPFSLRMTVGFGTTELDDGPEEFAGTGLSALKVVPFGPVAALLLEANLAVDPTPVAVRVAARVQPGDTWTLDAGVQVPVLLMVSHPVLVPALSLRGEW